MPMPNCDVCGDEAIGVASSTLGAVSFAYCRECLRVGADVPSIVAFSIASCGIDNVHEWVRNMIEPTIQRAKITRQQFDTMVKEAEQELADYKG